MLATQKLSRPDSTWSLASTLVDEGKAEENSLVPGPVPSADFGAIERIALKQDLPSLQSAASKQFVQKRTGIISACAIPHGVLDTPPPALVKLPRVMTPDPYSSQASKNSGIAVEFGLATRHDNTSRHADILALGTFLGLTLGCGVGASIYKLTVFTHAVDPTNVAVDNAVCASLVVSGLFLGATAGGLMANTLYKKFFNAGQLNS